MFQGVSYINQMKHQGCPQVLGYQLPLWMVTPTQSTAIFQGEWVRKRIRQTHLFVTSVLKLRQTKRVYRRPWKCMNGGTNVEECLTDTLVFFLFTGRLVHPLPHVPNACNSHNTKNKSNNLHNSTQSTVCCLPAWVVAAYGISTERKPRHSDGEIGV